MLALVFTLLFLIILHEMVNEFTQFLRVSYLSVNKVISPLSKRESPSAL